MSEFIDHEMIDLGRELEPRLLPGMMIRDDNDPDGERPIRNIEMAASMAYRKHARHWEAAGERWRQLFMEWLKEKHMQTKERYLGDSVYASFDGYHIWLDLRAQDATTRIALEPAVLVELNTFADEVYDREPKENAEESE